MLYRMYAKMTQRFSNLNSYTVFGILFLVTLFIRLPFFFRDYVDRDESTFILMGQSWVDGYLPYMQLWDLKPPLTFAFFAAIIGLFGKSFIAIRFFGALLVVLTSFFTYKISKELVVKKVSLYVGLVCVVFLSLFGSLQGVMSEHICMAFFMPAMYILIVKDKWYWFLVSGFFMGVVVMVKLNMAYPVLLLGVFLTYKKYLDKNRLVAPLVFGVGILLAVAATILPYYLNGAFIVWWESVILAPLEYASVRRSAIFKLMPYFVGVGLFLVITWRKKYLDYTKPTVVFLTVSILGVLFSFYKGGRINGHYLIQLYPMLLILVGLVVYKAAVYYKPKMPRALLLILLLIPMESYLEYKNIIANKINRGTYFNGEGFTVPAYILANKLDTKNILFMEYHIGYWNLNKLPPTKAATHPSNIFRDELFKFHKNPRENTLSELRYILEELAPKIVILRNGKPMFVKNQEEASTYINTYFTNHYKTIAIIENARILQRL